MSSTNRGAARNKADAYYTPHWLIQLIAAEVDWSQVRMALDPSAGDGRIAQVCIDVSEPAGPAWTEFELSRGQDYFERRALLHQMFDLGITNPPFSIALDFVKAMLEDCRNVIILQRLGFLGSQKRQPFWSAHPPTHLFVSARRPAFSNPDGTPVKPSGNNRPGTDSADYGWICWDHDEILRRPRGVYVI